MPADDPLAGLRALHLPAESASLWADVGFAAALGLLGAIAAAMIFRGLRKPRLSLRKSAVAAFMKTEALPVGERRAAQAAILRRVVKSVEGDEAARANGADWATTLDRVFRTDLFSAREGRVFVDGLYAPRPVTPTDDGALDRELGGLLARLKG